MQSRPSVYRLFLQLHRASRELSSFEAALFWRREAEAVYGLLPQHKLTRAEYRYIQPIYERFWVDMTSLPGRRPWRLWCWWTNLRLVLLTLRVRGIRRRISLRRVD